MSNRSLIDIVQNGSGNENYANNNFDVLEGGLLIVNRTTSAPPGSPTNGDAYIVASSASGDWTGMEGDVAVYSGGWVFFSPFNGFTCWVQAEDAYLVYSDVEGTDQPYITQGPQSTLVDGANIAVDTSLSNNFVVTLGGNRTLDNPNRVLPGQEYVIEVVQDGTGSRTLSYGTDYEFAGGSSPTLSTGAADRDVLVFKALSTTRLVLVASALNVS